MRTEPNAKQANQHQTALRIHGMTCGGCVARVEQALRGVEGVVDVRVNLTAESAWVETAIRRVGLQELVNAVRGAGYDAERAEAPSPTVAEEEFAAKLRRQRQALVQAIGLALLVIALEWPGPDTRLTVPPCPSRSRPRPPLFNVVRRQIPEKLPIHAKAAVITRLPGARFHLQEEEPHCAAIVPPVNLAEPIGICVCCVIPFRIGQHDVPATFLIGPFGG
jgi:copper chaperone CopZ